MLAAWREGAELGLAGAGAEGPSVSSEHDLSFDPLDRRHPEALRHNRGLCIESLQDDREVIELVVRRDATSCEEQIEAGLDSTETGGRTAPPACR